MMETIRWGILGPGRIAHSFTKDLALVRDGRLTAVASRNLERAREFADEYNAEFAFGSYEELLVSDKVDVIYIATPHTGHMEWAIKAMKSGKHILCEKPVGINLSQVKKMLRVAAENKVFLMEALWSRFNPSIRKIKQLVDDGVIGQVSYLHADFAFYSLDRDEKGRLLNPELAGGSILDIGIYPIFLAYLILGKPERILATSNLYKTGAEVQTSMIFQYDRAQAILYSGLTSKSEMRAEISGSKGEIFIDSRWHETQGFVSHIAETEKRYDLPTLGKGYTHEIDEVHRCLREGKLQSELWSHQNSIDLITLMDEVRRQGGITFPFE
ncbi:Gfo/Idh/MocA family oxidoreductase [Aggregatimonas sangjinii]|uniref:Gfo/Idh/MocA family oxidoreductase n=1 Tax=Aggregatimonas sangjinii TaxID=2583587 RepID=A0A5B7STD0_9FLAO|nr:Gfo/Idh/MocA family oxidoreductase [Aggregatimonas sangjinii]QCX00171.1 Gfo/Idh/MocA family oxidoreductase [Aggregatimonas sangjinii]